MTDATETLTIDAFIEARLDEDEQLARAAAEADGMDWFPVDAEYGDSPDRVEGTGDGAVGYDMYETVPPHIARHDPARVLRQCAALRAIMRVNADVADSDSGAAIQVAEAIASIWSSHPNFREEWTA